MQPGDITVALFTMDADMADPADTERPAILPGNVVMEFVAIPPGEFRMGCSSGDIECGAGETPAHPVRITKAFDMGRHEVTQAQWAAVMGFII